MQSKKLEISPKFKGGRMLINSKKGKKGVVFVKCTKRNVFCTLMDLSDEKVKTSCSLRVPSYVNEYNERENPYVRGVLLGELFGSKIMELGYINLTIFLGSGLNKGRRGFLRGLAHTKSISISCLRLGSGYPHNGCRPSKVRRKKNRTKPKLLR